MKIMHTLVVMSMALSLSVAHAGEREPKIASNTSGISDSEFISNIAGASVGMGACTSQRCRLLSVCYNYRLFFCPPTKPL